MSSNFGTGCKHCEAFIDGSNRFDDSVNHYLENHGYQLLHVGQQTIRDDDGHPCHTTVAIVGSSNPPAFREVSVEFKTYKPEE